MAITSFTFAVFVFVVLVIYCLLPRRAQNYWLLISSYIFHISWAIQFAIVLIISTVVNYYLAFRLRPGSSRRTGFLWIGIGFNLAALIVFRLANFYLPEITAFMEELGINISGDGLKVLMPVGLSFYALQNISYLIDVYRGQIPASDDLIDFGLYLAYFPKLLAGPIERARSFLPRLAEPRLVNNKTLSQGVTLIIVGLTRKIIIADTLTAAIPWDVFTQPANFSTIELWLWLFVYAFAIYNDFAGYTSIVRGISGLFGIDLSPNFIFPYFSRNFSEFWSRWHISLSNWLRGYIYYPLSRMLVKWVPSRYHPATLILPPLATMLASGLWHGFSWNMLVWGGLHGLYLVLERAIALWRPGRGGPRPLWRELTSMAVIFILVSIAWVPFRMDLPVAIDYWIGLVSWTSVGFRYSRIFLVTPLLAAAVCWDWLLFRRQGEQTILSWPRLAQAVAIGAVSFLLYILSQTEQVNQFVYQGF